MLWHLAVVVVLTILFAVLLVADAPGSGKGANIGLALFLLPVLVIGLPWSVGSYLLSLLVSGRTPVLATLVLVVQLVPAWLNVAVHLRLYRRAQRRERPAT